MIRFLCVMLYFAYGSNLDAHNWKAWCASKGYDAASIEPIGPAWLPDHELAFHYRSRLRSGGALDVRKRLGTSTPGALFRVHDWEALDAKEGVSGGYYRRYQVSALTADGHAHRATTYRVCEERIQTGLVAPGPEYREMVLRGLSRFGHDHEGFLSAARGETAVPAPNAIFTYGTLMSGQARHELLAPRVRRAHGPALVTGASLIEIDWYPGLVLSREGAVHGELYELDDVEATLGELDAYEDFVGYDREGSLYRRSLIGAMTSAGAMLAWTYVYLGEAAGRRVIVSGRWSGA
ncbi:MAG: gamma-glutamylcyclotransferase [Myxococcales bacterium]|jgi:gamma-glutamylcyclotransferase (GGCT)/AIG2-like uncharacterized protein YtfP